MHLRVSDDRRSLVHDDGSPFFYLGDTAWELFHRLDRDEAGFYLEKRAEQGFSVIQAVALAEFGGLRTPNAYGDLPLHDEDPARPNEAYFRHVDFIVARAGRLGMHVGLLPSWGDKVGGGIGEGPEVFTPANALDYGAFLGARYRDSDVVWILGGDRAAAAPEVQAVWRALAEGLRRGDGGRHLMTFHPPGGHSSGDYFRADDWLDFTLRQSGHVALMPNYAGIAEDYAREPTRPCLDGEPCYEDHPVMTLQWTPTDDWYGEHAVRRAAYWSLLAGSCGHVYGCHPVWQFWDERRPPINGARTPWRAALGLPGAEQMRHVRALIESRPSGTRVPDQSLLAGDPGEGAGHVQAARDAGGRFAFVYLPLGRPVAVDLGRLTGATVAACWYDPRRGTALPLGEFQRQGRREFSPPASGPDWVLVLDDAGQGFAPPGTKGE